MDLPDASAGQEFGLDALRCPHCGGDYLHAKNPEYYGDLIKPSVQRGSDDFVIGFWCESCSAEPSLSILQHKGQTFIEWSEIVLPEGHQKTTELKRQPIEPTVTLNPNQSSKGKSIGDWSIDEDGWLSLPLRPDELAVVGFEWCNSSAQILDWIFHYRSRLSSQEMASLLQAFEVILNPRQNYCSFGQDKRANGLDLLNQWLKPTTKRQPIKPGIRFQVLKRDRYRCQMCGVTAQDDAKLEIDHIHPVSKGGGNELSNLQVLCRDCNAGKRDQLL